MVHEEITTQTPLRLPLGGGGTDLPSYSDRFGGYFVAGTINHYVTITVRPADETTLTHNGATVDPAYVHAALAELEWQGGVEVESSCDIPSGSGLGGSGAFLVGLVNALCAMRGETLQPTQLAESAFRIEARRLGRTVGRQDHFAAAYGGMRAYDVFFHGYTSVAPSLSVHLQYLLGHRLLLFATGQTRDAAVILATQADTTETEVLNALHVIKQHGRETWLVLRIEQIPYYAGHLIKHWAAKQSISGSITNERINSAINTGLAAGAKACKLMGAGGGGYLQFYCEPEDQGALRAAMQGAGLPELPFEFVQEGSCVLEHNVLTGSG